MPFLRDFFSKCAKNVFGAVVSVIFLVDGVAVLPTLAVSGLVKIVSAALTKPNRVKLTPIASYVCKLFENKNISSSQKLAI